MRNILLLSALFCIIIVYSCTKNSTNYTTVDNRDTTGFVVNGLSDINLETKDSLFIPLSIDWVSGNKANNTNLTISISGIPDSVLAFITPQSGYPSFDATILLVSSHATLGTYPIKVTVANDAAGVRRTYDLRLNVVPRFNCIDEIIGSYSIKFDCQANDTVSYSSSIIAATGNNKVEIMGLYAYSQFGPPIDIIGTLNCKDRTVTITSQSVLTTMGTKKVSGSGMYFEDSAVVINYMIKHNTNDTVERNCSAVFKRN